MPRNCTNDEKNNLKIIFKPRNILIFSCYVCIWQKLPQREIIKEVECSGEKWTLVDMIIFVSPSEPFQTYLYPFASLKRSLMKCWGIILRWIRLLRRKKKKKTICTQLHFESERFWISKAVHETHPDNADFFPFSSFNPCNSLFMENSKRLMLISFLKIHLKNFSLFRSWSLEQLPDDSMPSTVTCISVEYILCLFSSPLFVCPEFVPVLFPADFPPPRNPM